VAVPVERSGDASRADGRPTQGRCSVVFACEMSRVPDRREGSAIHSVAAAPRVASEDYGNTPTATESTSPFAAMSNAVK
jgi:hypothetical protein